MTQEFQPTTASKNYAAQDLTLKSSKNPSNAGQLGSFALYSRLTTVSILL